MNQRTRKHRLASPGCGRELRAGIAALTSSALLALPCSAETPQIRTLGAAPLCEASAALAIDCPTGAGRCLLVGDNEVGRALFLFRLNSQGIDPASQRELPLDGHAELADIEAMAALPNGRVAVFGSHARASDCEIKPKRHRHGIVERITASGVSVAVVQSDAIGCAALFGSAAPTQPLLRAACEEIAAAEREASAIDERRRTDRITSSKAKKECNRAAAYNAEGAVNVSAGATPDLWIGLRAPLLRRHPSEPGKRNLAMLLHLRSLDRYSFDRVVALDLGARGVRDLAFDKGWVWVIAGPAQDQRDGEESPFQLMRFPASQLARDEVIVPERVGSGLPPRSEGIAVHGENLVLLIDGDQPTKARPSECGDNKPGFVTLPQRLR